jgi:cytochrome c-type biogenesis protein CcsB
MRRVLLVLAALLAAGAPARGEGPKPLPWNWDQWRNLPVQDGGRQKPLDTLAWETFRSLSNRTRFADPQTGEPLDSTALYLAMLLEWPGWDRPLNPQATDAELRAGYFAARQPDKWDLSRLLLVDSLELRRNLGMSQDQKCISPWKLSQAKIRDPKTGAETLFITWAERKLDRKQQGQTPLERKSLELADRYWTYQDLRMGQRLTVLPVPASEAREWLPVAYLVQAPMLGLMDPSGQMPRAAEQLQSIRAAYLARSPAAFNQASAEFLATVRSLGPKLGDYPRQKVIDLEVAYNHWAPFRFAWIFTMTAALGMLLAMGTRWKWFYLGALGLFAAGMAAMLVGFGMRVAISGRAPVTNMYESVIYVGLGTALFGLVFELIYRKRYILTAAACVSTLALIMADNCPAHLDPTIHPLQPVLRSNYWLILHVMTITLSYAAFALALGIANITLGYFLVRSKSRETIAALSRFTYKVLQVGVLLLAAGTILGGVWADYSWGRFWGWDPKEVWALIALLGYLAVLHARHVNWVGHFGLATSAVACFALVVVAWYGVNFVMGAGLHSYGFGGGGEGYVGGVLAAQFLYVALAALRSRNMPDDPVLDSPTPRRDLACASG